MSSRRSPGRPAVWIGAVLSAWLLLFGTSTAAGEPRIVVLGDSLTAGFGLPREDAFRRVWKPRSGPKATAGK